MQLTRSRFSNIVLMSAKNFQFVKLSQADLGTTNPASDDIDN